jgi:hypothetical protein
MDLHKGTALDRLNQAYWAIRLKHNPDMATALSNLSQAYKECLQDRVDVIITSKWHGDQTDRMPGFVVLHEYEERNNQKAKSCVI